MNYFKSGMVVHICGFTWEAEEGLWSDTGLGKNVRPYLKNKLKTKG
jgi:hypothetical protein